MLVPLKYKIITSTVLGLGALEGFYGYKYRGYMGKDRPTEIQNCVDPRIMPATKESFPLKFVRGTNYAIGRYGMKFIAHVMNNTHYYNITSFYKALERPKDVGLLTICNHVSVLDSALLIPSIIPFKYLFDVRNSNAWNLGAEDIMFNTVPKAMFDSLIKIMPIDRNGGVFQAALSDFSQRGKYGDWIHMFPEGKTYQDQLKACRNANGQRYRKSGRTAPPGRDLGPMKWGVGKVISDIIMDKMESTKSYSFENGVNNGRLMVLPYYHLNMEKIMPENEDLKLDGFLPRKGNDIFCMFGNPIDFSDIIPPFYEKLQTISDSKEKEVVQYQLYKAITDRVEQSLESLEYTLKDIRSKKSYAS